VALAHSLDLGIVAEGIENERQTQLLRDLGCHVGQGYLYGRALDANDATRLLEAQAHEERAP
jgi:EAL domain-containing protein (putative c-di-GMP-specific phosphodiesterase class I)